MMKGLFINGNFASIVSGSGFVFRTICNLYACLFVLLPDLGTFFVNVAKFLVGGHPRWRVNLIACYAILVIFFAAHQSKANDCNQNKLFHSFCFTQSYKLIQCQ